MISIKELCSKELVSAKPLKRQRAITLALPYLADADARLSRIRAKNQRSDLRRVAVTEEVEDVDEYFSTCERQDGEGPETAGRPSHHQQG